MGHHDIKCSDNDEIVIIISSCNGGTRRVVRHSDKTMLAQTTGVLSKSSMSENKRNLAKPGNLLSTMSSNGKENVENISKALETCFT